MSSGDLITRVASQDTLLDAYWGSCFRRKRNGLESVL